MADVMPRILTVGQLNGQIRDTLLGAFRDVWVAGEISDLGRPRSGHMYFSLKDSSGSIKAVLWRSNVARLRFEPEDGMQVLCCGDIDVYPPRGTYQLIVRTMQMQGEGALQATLRKLHDKLEAEGLFVAARKRSLPPFPKRLAIVTSPSGAALRDFLEVVRRRWSDLELFIVPTQVQGMMAAPQVANSIRKAAKLPFVDAILVTRGGGSLEDLWAFNDEGVIRAIHASPVPVVSAIGHEIDVTLSDLVADIRALTPSEAGELLVPDGAEIVSQLQGFGRRIRSLMYARFDHAQARFQAVAQSRAIRDPLVTVRDRERVLDDLHQRATRAVKYQAERSGSKVLSLSSRLESLSPLKVLSRGYSLIQKADGSLVRSADQLELDDQIKVRLSDGQVLAIVHERILSKKKQRSREDE